MTDVEQHPDAAIADPYSGGDYGEGNDQVDFVGERGNWQPRDADGFHWALSRHTRLEAGVLHLDHRYLDFRDIDMVESLEDVTQGQRPTDNDIIRRLEVHNESNPNRDCRRLYLLVRELQKAAGSKHTLRQINTKHINTRSRWSVPFKSLNEVGYLIKNQGSSRDKKNIDGSAPSCRTNIGRKNLAATKALRKFTKYKELYWCYATGSMPDAQVQAAISAAHPEIDDMSEPERWARAMIRRHGRPMVDYLDVCSFKLAQSYYLEVAARQGASPPAPLAASDTDRIGQLLSAMVDEVSAMTSEPKQKKGGRRKTSTSGGQRKRSGKSAGEPPAIVAQESYQSVTSTDGYLTVNTNDFPEFKRPTSSRPTDGLASDREYLDELGLPQMIKKSRSHIFGSSSSGAAAAAEAAANQGPYQYLDMAAYERMNSFTSSLFPGDTSAPVTGRALPYDDGLFSQFLNYDPSAGRDADSAVPADLTEGIFNLTVEAGSTPAPQTAHAQSHYSHHHHHHTPSDALDYGAIMSNPATAYHAAGDAAHQYLGSGLHQGPSPSGLARSTSDEANFPGIFIGSNEAVGDLQGLFGGKESAFTFHMPPYAWASGSAPDDQGLLQPGSQFPGQPAALSQSMSFPSLTAYESSLAADPRSADSGAGLYAGESVSPPVSSRSTTHVASQPDQPDQPAQAKLSTRLVYVNGVPSHIELLHDSGDVAQNPIILPISEVRDKV